mgnify:CR=1 FL=1
MLARPNSGQPLVSVVLPVRNGEQWLEESLQSIKDQTFSNFEVVVVDDHSTDHSMQVVRDMNLRNLRIVRGRGEGLATALSVGISAAKGALIARQDQDDVSSPVRFERQVDFLSTNPDYVACGSAAWLFGETFGQPRVLKAPESDASIRLNLLIRNPMVHSSVMMVKKAVESVGGYQSPSNMAYPEDYSLWSRLAKAGKLANLPTPLVHYRHDASGSIMSDFGPVVARAAADISIENVTALLGSSEVDANAQELLAMLHMRHRRISPVEARQLLMLLFRIRSRFPLWMREGWPTGTFTKVPFWIIKKPRHH